MSEVKKISQPELDKINFIKKESVEIASALGELNYQKILVDLQIEAQKQKIIDLRKDEQSLFEGLRANYGNVNVNLETGEFTVVE
jgi:2C-methyl-D-erythritol 2,4-cyclodiphosphate synthase